MSERSLYERLGGVNAIGARLPDLKFMRTLWLCEIAGGNFHYSGKALGDAHKDLRRGLARPGCDGLRIRHAAPGA